MPAMMVDDVIGVSEYVVRRQVEVDLVPAARVRRIWNSVEIPARRTNARDELRRTFDLRPDAMVVACACRATRVKGIEHALRAFDGLGHDAVLLYLGDGPDLKRLEQVRAGLKRADRVIFGGYRPNAADLLEGADVCVVPSIWHEAFGLSALEPLARGVPVVASRVGGIPEIVVDGETGVLVAPGDEQELTAALRRLLSDPAERQRMGENGRRRAAQYFSLAGEIDQLHALVEAGFSGQNPIRSNHVP